MPLNLKTEEVKAEATRRASHSKPLGVPMTLDADQRHLAKRACSRVLPPWVNAVLKAAADGQKVDAFTFSAATTQVLSLAATREGQSMGRRYWTAEGRALSYAAQDALAEALLSKAPIDQGNLIACLRADITAAKFEAQETLLPVLRERNELREENVALRKYVDLLASDLAAARDSLTQAQADADYSDRRARRVARVLDFALSLLGDFDRGQVTGYRRALDEED